MSIEFELLETFTGDRDGTPCTDVMVRFTHQDIVHERAVNVCLDDKGDYDEDATLERIGQVGRGVMVKIEAGLIQSVPEPEEVDGAPE